MGITLMKGDKVIQSFQILTQYSLLIYFRNGNNSIPHQFFIEVIHCTTRSK